VDGANGYLDPELAELVGDLLDGPSLRTALEEPRRQFAANEVLRDAEDTAAGRR
jgi:hypothetical protein